MPTPPIPGEPQTAAPRWRTAEAEAARRGFPSAAALIKWCRRRGVPYRRDGGINWVQPEAIDRAIEGMPEVRGATTDLDDWISSLPPRR